MGHHTTKANGDGRSAAGRAKPTLGPPKVVVHGAWGRALPAPKPGEKEESIFTSWVMGLLGRQHPGALDERDEAPARR